MALEGKGTRITMDYGDYGIQLPIDIDGAVFEDTDTMIFELKKSKNSYPIIKKNIQTHLMIIIYLDFS